jgi:hypothetical protein
MHRLLTLFITSHFTDLCVPQCFQEALRNILIVFAKLNPGIRYVQGMNELLAPLFYVFRNDPDEEYAVSTCQFIYFNFLGGHVSVFFLFFLKYLICV